MVKMEKETNIPLTKEFRMDMARVEIPVSGWTCLRTGIRIHVSDAETRSADKMDAS